MVVPLSLIDYLKSLSPDTPCSETLNEFFQDATFDFNKKMENGQSLLHLAVATGNQEATKAVLSLGHPWNVLDDHGISVGELAKSLGHLELYDFLVHEGARTEMLLYAMGLSGKSHNPNEVDDDQEPSNAEYLNSKLTFSHGRLVDEEQNGVMMGWETPLMRIHADILEPQGRRILNIGFGLGIIDTEIQKRHPKTHTIIEAHPDVYKKMIEDGWDKKENVVILFGRWQDVLKDHAETYDGIFFDTFGEYYDDMKEFHEFLPNILDSDGIYSYFNGLAGTNSFFHDVSCSIAEFDLYEIGLKTEMIDVNMDALGDEEWQGIKRPYFNLPVYHAPKCSFAF